MPEELKRLEDRLEALGIGYTRMELCLIELARQIQGLVEQNAALLQAIADRDEAEGHDEDAIPESLSNKRR